MSSTNVNVQLVILLMLIWVHSLKCTKASSTITNSSLTLANTTTKPEYVKPNPTVVSTGNQTFQLSQPQRCYCMEKRNCTRNRGEVYSYCGTSDTEVCCILPSNQVNNNRSVLLVNNSLGNAAELKPNELIKLLELDSSSSSSTSKFEVSRRKSSPKTIHCGQSLNNGTVDSVAKFKEWPWHVAILEAKGDLYICGGSFMENEDGQQFILTAGHCVINYMKSLKRLKVRLGEFDVSTNSEPLPHVEVLVKSIEIHPRFKNTGNLQNDIGILRLNNSIRLENRDNIRPICLPPDTHPGTKPAANLSTCVVTGWGRKYEHSPYSVILKEIHVPVWEHKTCENNLRNLFGPSYALSSTVICAGDKDRDACDGDGGGALACFDGNKWVQQGIVSWGIGCGRNHPGIYTRVSSYLTWINSLFIVPHSSKPE